MRTDDWIALLARGAGAVEPNPVGRRFALALGWGGFGAALVMALVLPVRPDIGEAVRLPMFWIKLAFPLALATAGLAAVARLAQPGARVGRVPFALVVPLVVMWALAAVTLAGAPAGEREALVLGSTWKACPFNIALLSLPALVGTLWATKGLAPTRLAWAGGAAGLLAGAIGAAIYTLHCPEMEAPFIGVWYVLGIAIPAAAGALAGPLVLRW